MLATDAPALANATLLAANATSNVTKVVEALQPYLFSRLVSPPALCRWLLENGLSDPDLHGLNCTSNEANARLPAEICSPLWELGVPLNTSENGYCKSAPRPASDDILRASLLVVLAVVAFIGNCFTIQSIRSKANPAPVYKLIMHLSVADVLVSLLCITPEAIWMFNQEWVFGEVACKVFKFLEITVLHGSAYVVVLIAQNRWVAVSQPLASRRKPPSLGAHVKDIVRCASPRSVFFVWLLAACISIPMLFVFSVVEGPFFEVFHQCVSFRAELSERVYTTLSFVTLFVFPLLLLCCSYMSIIFTLSKGQRKMRSVNRTSIATFDQNRQRSMKRAVHTSGWLAVVIVICYVICWLPYSISMFAHLMWPDWKDKWMEYIFCFGMANSAVNPVIYGFFQLRNPRRRMHGSCIRQRDGSTQLTQLTDSFRRHGGISLAPVDTTACNGDSNGVPPLSRMPSRDGSFFPPPLSRMSSRDSSAFPPPLTRMPSRDSSAFPPPLTRMPSRDSSAFPPPLTRMPSRDSSAFPPPLTRMPSRDSSAFPPPLTRMPSRDSSAFPPPLTRMPSRDSGAFPPPLSRVPSRDQTMPMRASDQTPVSLVMEAAPATVEGDATDATKEVTQTLLDDDTDLKRDNGALRNGEATLVRGRVSKAAPCSWRDRFVRKYRAIRVHQARI